MKNTALKIAKPADALLPLAFLIASLLGRSTTAIRLFLCFYAVKLCALATSDGLRRTFAGQPSMKSVQGSAILALILQCMGALIAGFIIPIFHWDPALRPLIPCGLLLNIEHVFYEYLYAAGDDHGAAMYRSITALLTLTGLMLYAPSANDPVPLGGRETACLLIAIGLTLPVGFTVSLVLGGKIAPRMNPEALHAFPLSMFRVALYPFAALATLRMLMPAISPAVPLFSGLILYSLCISPFRRTPRESKPLNRALLVAALIALSIGTIFHFIPENSLTAVVTPVCLCLMIAAACAFALYGNFRLKSREDA